MIKFLVTDFTIFSFTTTLFKAEKKCVVGNYPKEMQLFLPVYIISLMFLTVLPILYVNLVLKGKYFITSWLSEIGIKILAVPCLAFTVIMSINLR